MPRHTPRSRSFTASLSTMTPHAAMRRNTENFHERSGRGVTAAGSGAVHLSVGCAVARGPELGAAMHSYDYWLILAFFALVLVPAPFLGRFYYKVMEGQRTWLTPILGPVERGCYRLAGSIRRPNRAGRSTHWPCSRSASQASCCCSRSWCSRTICRSTRKTCQVWSGRWRSTPPSAS